ncbi:MAG: TIGR03905 family TSCPD domain-containing protein [Lentisphaeria bacterium]|nr:TIGR03905 family TSCPD domain-containing protein [Lentisphaeria bacterium]
MKQYRYETSNEVCSSAITLSLSDDGDTVLAVKFHGGCAGSLAAVSKLAAGRNVDEVIKLLSGTPCGGKGTSCPDQLAVMLEKIKSKSFKS